MPFVRPYATPTFHSNHLAQVQTTAPASARRLPVIDVNLGALQRHHRAPSRADSVSSESSTSSTLVDGAEASMPIYLDDEPVMMHLDYMLPVSAECSIPPSPSSSHQPDEPMLVTPSSSSVNLLSHHPTSTSARSRLWLHRHKRQPAARNSPPPSPNDSRTQSFLTSLLQARWPKTETEQPIFGQTAPRAVSPFRGKQRPPSAASVPRSILRVDTHANPHTIKSSRSLGCVKFAAQPGVWEYSHPEEETDGLDDRHPRIAWRHQKDSDGDSIITLPPPGERTQSDSLLKRFMGTTPKSTKSAKERPVISGPMPLARASSLREMKEANRSHTELLKEISTGPPKKGNKLRSLMGRYLKVS